MKRGSPEWRKKVEALVEASPLDPEYLKAKMSEREALEFRVLVHSLFIERGPMFKRGVLQVWWGVLLLALSVLMPFVHVWGVQFGPDILRPYEVSQYRTIDAWGTACFLAAFFLVVASVFNVARGMVRYTNPSET